MRGRLIRFGSNMFFKGKSYELPMEIWKAIKDSNRNIDETQSIYKSVLFMESYGEEGPRHDESGDWISPADYTFFGGKKIVYEKNETYIYFDCRVPDEIRDEWIRNRGQIRQNMPEPGKHSCYYTFFRGDYR